MTKLDELKKAIEEAADTGVTMLRKSQMSLDFSAPNPHHVAYTRTNASGTVSNIQAKGAPKVEIKRVSSSEQNVSQRHVSYDVHVDGKYHSTHNDINDALDHKERLEQQTKGAPTIRNTEQMVKFHEDKADHHKKQAEKHSRNNNED